MEYLFWSQTIIWAVLTGYIILLTKKSRELEKQLDIIKKESDKNK